MVFKMLIIFSAGKSCDAYRQELKRRYSVQWLELWIAESASCYVYSAATNEAQQQSCDTPKYQKTGNYIVW